MHNLLIKSNLQVGTKLVTEFGRGVVGEDGQAGVTLWGDDPTTNTIEGFAAGEVPTVRISDDDKVLISAC